MKLKYLPNQVKSKSVSKVLLFAFIYYDDKVLYRTLRGKKSRVGKSKQYRLFV